MNITPKDILDEFRKYPSYHPLYALTQVYDNNGVPELKPDTTWAINSFNAIGRALITLARFSEKAYKDMISSKLLAKDKDYFNRHNLISAFCELSLMNTFICRSTNPESFVYEDRLRDDSKKNVEFSIKMDNFTFHIEVKTSDLNNEDAKIAKAIKNSSSKKVLVIDSHNDKYEEIVKKSTLPIIGSLDRRIVDYLKDSNKKFAKTDDEKEVNLLVICWDDRVHLPLMALKSKKAEGALTSNSYLKNEDGSPVSFDNVDCVLVNSNYWLFKEYSALILFERFSPEFPVDPFFQVFTNNYLIDHNLTTDRTNMIHSIIQSSPIIVTEQYAESLSETSIAFMKDESTPVISFRKCDIDDVLDKMEQGEEIVVE